MKETVCEKVKEMFEGDVTISKKELWLLGTCLTLLGIVYGLLKAPYTHGVKIGCDNGNNCGNGNDLPNLETDEAVKAIRDLKDKKEKKHRRRSCCEK